MRKRNLGILVLVLIILTSIAYSGLATSASITSEAIFRVKANIRVTDIRLKQATSGAVIQYESEYDVNSITSGFNLASTSSTISYEVDITNNGEIDQAIFGMSTTSINNSGMNILIDGKSISSALPIIVPYQTKKTITVTYSSSSPGKIDITNTFDFRKVYYITYETNGGTAVSKTIKYENEDAQISTTEPTKTGVRFIGWTDLQAAEVAKSSFAPGATYSENSNKVLYAVYSGTLCKRASSLHTATCGYTSGSSYCYADGYYKGGEKNTTEIYYGTLGQKVNNENVLTSGDAFVCDVNGDGTYNETNELFYYITNLESNNNYAVLLYSQDTSSGTVAYDSSNENWHGPQTAVSSLPTTSTWDNISLSSTSRQLYATSDLSTYVTTNNGSNTLGTFSYSGKAGRLLTVKELRTGCPNASTTSGSLSSCNYLMENTKYDNSSNTNFGYWLETPHASYSSSVWNVYGDRRYLNIYSANYSNSFGARPAIEVPKTSIDLDIKSYFITFNTQSDFTENQFKTISVGDEIGELPTPKRRGYKFEGWYTDTNYTTQVTITTKPSSSTTYYAKWSENIICKRASSLHTETCGYTSGSYYCYADGYYVGGSKNTRTITYGNFGTNSSTINAGDAFVCDVNGDGSFNETNEKFYYVSDYYDTETQSFDTNEAVLIYYKDTSDSTVAYDSSSENWHGPQKALNSLPDETTWKNVYLKESKRQLYAWYNSNPDVYNTTTTDSGNQTLGKFDYGTKAGRLLTVKELRTGCPNASTSVGSLSSCSYLMENTKYENSSNPYGYWLETPHASYSNRVWFVYGNRRSLYSDFADNSGDYGARPAIEVPKASINKTVRGRSIVFNTNLDSTPTNVSSGTTVTGVSNYGNTVKQISVGSAVGTLPSDPVASVTIDGDTYQLKFDGWYTAATGGTAITAATVPTASTTYYAHYHLVLASEVSYDNTDTGLNASTVQGALDIIKCMLDGGTDCNGE